MNERAVVDEMLIKIDTLARFQQCKKVLEVEVRVGARAECRFGFDDHARA